MPGGAVVASATSTSNSTPPQTAPPSPPQTPSPTLTQAQKDAQNKIDTYNSSLQQYTQQKQDLQSKVDSLNKDIQSKTVPNMVYVNKSKFQGYEQQGTKFTGTPDEFTAFNTAQQALSDFMKTPAPVAPTDVLGNTLTDVNTPFAIAAKDLPVRYTYSNGNNPGSRITGYTALKEITFSDNTVKDIPRELSTATHQLVGPGTPGMSKSEYDTVREKMALSPAQLFYGENVNIPEAVLFNAGISYKPADVPANLQGRNFDNPAQQAVVLAGLVQESSPNGFLNQNLLQKNIVKAGYAFDPTSGIVSNPELQNRLNEASINVERNGLPGGGFGGGGPETPQSAGKNFGQAALGYSQGQYSSEQVASMISAAKTNQEYGNKPSMLVGNLNTENSTGPVAALNKTHNTDHPLVNTVQEHPLVTGKSDTSSLAEVPLVNVGGHKILADLISGQEKPSLFSVSPDIENFVSGIAAKGGKQVNIYDTKTGARIGTVSTDKNGMELISEIAATQSIYLRQTPNAEAIRQNNIINDNFRDFISGNANKGAAIDILIGNKTIGSVSGPNAFHDLLGITEKHKGESITALPRLIPVSKTETPTKLSGIDQGIQQVFDALENFKEANKNNVVLSSLASAAEFGLSNITFIQTSNLQKQAGEFLYKTFTGKEPSERLTPLKLPYDPSSYPIDTLVGGITSGGNFLGAESAARSQLTQQIEKEGPASIATKAILDFLAFAPVSNEGVPIITKALPIRFGREINAIRFEGIGEVQVSKALPSVLTEGPKTIEVSGPISLGYLGKNAIGIGFKSSEGESLPFISKLNPATDLKSSLEKFTAISPRGAEAGYVSPLTISKVYTPQGSQVLSDLGKITTEQQNDLVVPASNVMKAIQKIPDVKISATELSDMIKQTGLTDNPEVADKIVNVIKTVQNPGKTAIAYAIALKSGNKELTEAYKPFINPLNAFPAGKGSVINILQLTKFNQDKTVSELITEANISRLSGPSVPDDIVPTRSPSQMGDLLDVDLKSEKQSEQLLNLLNKADIADEGFGFGRSGLNITYGKSEDVLSFDKIKLKDNEILHGTNKESALDILQNGFQTDKSARADFAFGTPNQSLAEHFAERASEKTRDIPALVKINTNQNKILKFEDLSKIEQADIISSAKALEKNQNVPAWLAFQRTLATKAKLEGFKGVEKPYDVGNPFNTKARKSEILIFDQKAIKGVNSIINPVVTKQVLEGDDLLNLLGKQDEIATDASAYSKGKSFGIEQPHKIVNQGGLKTKSIQFQGWAKLKSLTSYQTLDTLNNFKERATPEIYEKALERFQGKEMILRTPFIRDKDIPDAYSILRYGEQTVKGKAGKLLGEYANAIEKHFTDVDFSILNEEVEQGKVAITGIPKENAGQGLKTVAPGAALGINDQNNQEKPGIGNIIGKPITKGQKPTQIENFLTDERQLAIERDMRSREIERLHQDNLSVKSSRSMSHFESPRFLSAKSVSMASPRSPLSPKSPSQFSIKSPASPRSPLSPKSPSSPSSPLSSKNLSSPLSPKSPSSPGSLSSKSPSSPLSPKSPFSLGSSLFNSIGISKDISILTGKETPKPPVPLFLLNTKPDQRVIRKTSDRYNFLGNSPEDQIIGLFNRQETVYGNKTINKLLGKDRSITKKNQNRSFTNGKSKLGGLLGHKGSKKLRL
jgi:hypothetical protein